MTAPARGRGHRKRRLPPATLPRPTVDNTALSFRAVGALLWINSRPDGWVIRAAQMASEDKRPDGTNSAGRPHRREGRDAIRNVLMNELAPEGYYRLERRRLLDGTIEMGTASSEEPVESWAAQYRLFGRNAVPLIEQPDGTFMVQYPDGTLGPDDCDPPEAVYQGDVEPADEYAGQTGDGFSGPGNPESADDTSDPGPENPAPVQPAPGNPGPGFPAPDHQAPLEEEEVKGGIKDPPTPQRESDGVADPSPSETRGGDSSKTDLDLARVVAWFARRRTDWPKATIAEALTTAVAKGLGTLPECAAALRELAEDTDGSRFGATGSPNRLHAHSTGLWWAAVQAKRAAVAARRAAAAPRCRRRGHEHEPADGCAQCAGEAKGRPDEPTTPTPQAQARAEAALRRVVERRRARGEPAPAAEALAS